MTKLPVSVLMVQLEPLLEIVVLVRKMGPGLPGFRAGVPGCRWYTRCVEAYGKQGALGSVGKHEVQNIDSSLVST